jgi:hypothetical protein
MKTHRSLWHVLMRTDGAVGSHRREPSKGTVRARAQRGILVLALGLGGLGAAALTLPGHASAGHVHASTHQPAGRPVVSTATGSTTSVKAVPRPWMY